MAFKVAFIAAAAFFLVTAAAAEVTVLDEDNFDETVRVPRAQCLVSF